MRKNESLEKINQKNDNSFHSNRENSPFKDHSTSIKKENRNSPNSEGFHIKPDAYNNFNQKPMNFLNFPNNSAFEMGSNLMYIMNFYEFHLNNMQSIIMQKNDEILVNMSCFLNFINLEFFH